MGSGIGAGADAREDRRTAQPGESARAFLRRVTRPWHDGVEDAFAPFDLATADGLGGFLLRQAAVVLPLEAALEAAGVAVLVPDWNERRRGAALRADLWSLGLAHPVDPVAIELPSPAHGLGSLYVLEGSKLGGRVLLHRVLASPDPQVRAASRFLGHHQPGGWARFTAFLDATLVEALPALQAGAEAAFALFEAAARHQVSTAARSAPADAPLVQFVHA